MEDIGTYEHPPYDVYAHYGRNIIERAMENVHLPVTWQSPAPAPPPDAREDDFCVGILGAGAGGLYVAMMLQSLGIRFKILEATDRVGGRLYTHHFKKPDGSSNEFDYYDVGAMRFPDTPIMHRLFHLFKTVGLKEEDGSLIEYFFQADNTIRMYNGIREIQKNNTPSKSHFDFQKTGVPSDDLNVGAKTLQSNALEKLVQGLLDDLKYHRKDGWHALMKEDGHSARSYLTQVKNIKPSTVNWMETYLDSTKWYDRALAETVLEAIIFGEGQQNFKWYCVRGGAEVIANKMKEKIEEKNRDFITFNEAATRIDANRDGVTVFTNKDNEHKFKHVISTIPLPVFRTLQIRDSGLGVMQQYALRLLAYGPSIKIGVKFKTRWWGEGSEPIVGGQSFSDRIVRTVVYPSYGLKGEKDKQTTVLIASYCWTEDAHRWSALIADTQREKPENPKSRELLKNLVLQDLADIHAKKLEDLKDELEDDGIYPWDWNASIYTQGAFAFFGPGDFSQIYPSLTAPNRYRNLHLAGEALSPRHAWVVGALDSAWRTVYWLVKRRFPGKLKEFFRLWGKDEDWTKPTPSLFTGQNWDEDFMFAHWTSQHATEPEEEV